MPGLHRCHSGAGSSRPQGMSVRGQRIVIGVLLLIALVTGLWAAVAPRSFYDSFPGSGLHWVSTDGPYNRHLVSDVGSMYLALAVVTVAAIMPARSSSNSANLLLISRRSARR